MIILYDEHGRVRSYLSIKYAQSNKGLYIDYNILKKIIQNTAYTSYCNYAQMGESVFLFDIPYKLNFIKITRLSKDEITIHAQFLNGKNKIINIKDR